jgi:hypothetical protein
MFAELQGMMWHKWFHQALGNGQTVVSHESLHNLACRRHDNFFGYRWSGMLLLHGFTFWFCWEVIDAWFITSNHPVKCLLSLSLILTKLFQSKSILVIFYSGFRSLGNNVVQAFWNGMRLCIVILSKLYECPLATAKLRSLTCLSAQIITDTWLNSSICHSFNCANRSVIIFQFWTSLWEFLNPV